MAGVRHSLILNLFHLDLQTNALMAVLAASTLVSGHAFMSGNNTYHIPPSLTAATEAAVEGPFLPSASIGVDIYQKLLHQAPATSGAVYKTADMSIPSANIIPVKNMTVSYQQKTATAEASTTSTALTKLAGPYAHDVKSAALAHHLSPRLIASVVYVETTGKKGIAVSKSGAIGPMQLMPKTARSKLHVNPWIPSENIDGGTQYLSELVGQFKSVRLALIAYNEGPSAVMRGHYNPQSIAYADKVMALASGKITPKA